MSANPARFDLKKCEAINAVKLRELAPDDLASRLAPFLTAAGLAASPPTDEQSRLIAAVVPLVQERMVVLSDIVGMAGFLFVSDADFAVDPADAEKVLTSDAAPVLAASVTALQALSTWSTSDIEAALRSALVEGMELKPKNAFTPVRVAVTGRRVSPPLFESLELLGRDRTLARLRAAQ